MADLDNLTEAELIARVEAYRIEAENHHRCVLESDRPSTRGDGYRFFHGTWLSPEQQDKLSRLILRSQIRLAVELHLLALVSVLFGLGLLKIFAFLFMP